MAVYKNSRYMKTKVKNVEGNLVLKRRNRVKFNSSKMTLYQYTVSDRLDLLAKKFYHDYQLWWIILEANTIYRTVLDIKVGDILKIPDYEEVMKWLAT